MTRRRSDRIQAEYYRCPGCGSIRDIQRHRLRGGAHLKWMWCVICQAVTNHERYEDE